jgi:predicted Zn finger-like uncharacterized protein
MASALSSTVVIECPHCGTRYQLPPEAIGPKGREVACAHCGQTWHADAVKVPAAERDADAMFDAVAERELDDAFTAAETAAKPVAAAPFSDENDADRMRTIAEIKAAIAPRSKPVDTKVDAAGEKKRQKAFNKRQALVSRQLPLAKVRRVARIGGVSALMALIIGGIAFRTDIVRQFPDLAGTYEALGLGVNVIGLEFRDVTTLVTLRGGARLMQVDGRIFSVAARSVVVPPVVVTLLDDAGAALYEWSVVPEVRDLEPGEVIDFSTQLSAPPASATRARLTFSDGRVTTDSPVVTAATTSE